MGSYIGAGTVKKVIEINPNTQQRRSLSFYLQIVGAIKVDKLAWPRKGWDGKVLQNRSSGESSYCNTKWKSLVQSLVPAAQHTVIYFMDDPKKCTFAAEDAVHHSNDQDSDHVAVHRSDADEDVQSEAYSNTDSLTTVQQYTKDGNLCHLVVVCSPRNNLGAT